MAIRWDSAPHLKMVNRLMVCFSTSELQCFSFYVCCLAFGVASDYASHQGSMSAADMKFWFLLHPDSTAQCDERVCVCPRAYLQNHTSDPDLPPIFVRYVWPWLTPPVAACYIFLVLWMTSYMHISWGCSTSPPGWGSHAALGFGP